MGERFEDEDFDVEGRGPQRPWRIALRWARDLALLAVLLLGTLTLSGWLRAPSLPDEAPGFTLLDLDGRPVSLADFRGRTVVLNFWATWCGPCRAEAPAFSSFAEAHPDVAVIGIAADGPAAKVRATARSIGTTYPVLLGDPATLAVYGVEMFPTTVIVGPDGSVRSAHAGLMLRPQLAWAAGEWW